jgi:hypothetical protein
MGAYAGFDNRAAAADVPAGCHLRICAPGGRPDQDDDFANEGRPT